MNDSKPISIENQIESMPPLPMTVSRVLEVTNNPESSANDLLKAILPDQTMCVAILKIANSVLYGRPKQVSSLETAVTVLGFNEIRNIVLAKAAVTAFNSIPKTHEKEIGAFWDHAFTCGLAARIIGEHINQPSGQFFIGGLLHDIGKLAMLLAFGEKYDTLKWFTGFSTTAKLQEEQQTFAITHEIVGAQLLRHWQFPDNLIAALHYHHTPNSSPLLQGYPLVIQLADFLSYMYIQPESPDEQTLKTALHAHLPDFEDQWRKQNLPWEEITLESLFAWVKVDGRHGSGILVFLAS
jgi:putative nucleotidyltransferase with HDIG domain